MAHGDAREGKWRGNWRMEWVASTLTHLVKWFIQHYYRWWTYLDCQHSTELTPPQIKMDSSVLPKDEIWFLLVCHHISNALYPPKLTHLVVVGASLFSVDGVSTSRLSLNLWPQCYSSELETVINQWTQYQRCWRNVLKFFSFDVESYVNLFSDRLKYYGVAEYEISVYLVVAHERWMRSTHTVLIGKPERKRPFGRHSYR